jgi:hypothetical protein
MYTNKYFIKIQSCYLNLLFFTTQTNLQNNKWFQCSQQNIIIKNKQKKIVIEFTCLWNYIYFVSFGALLKLKLKLKFKASYAVFSLVSVAAVSHASFRLILLLLARFVCVNCFLSTNLSSFLFPGCRMLLLCCLIYVVYTAAWSIGHNRFLQNPFQTSIHLFIYSSLHGIATEGDVKLPTNR